MSDRLTAEPGTLEFLRQLLEIAQESDHPMDKALTKVLSRQIGEAEGTLLPLSSEEIEYRRRMGRSEYILSKLRSEPTLHELIDDLWPAGEIPSYRDPAKWRLYHSEHLLAFNHRTGGA